MSNPIRLYTHRAEIALGKTLIVQISERTKLVDISIYSERRRGPIVSDRRTRKVKQAVSAQEARAYLMRARSYYDNSELYAAMRFLEKHCELIKQAGAQCGIVERPKEHTS